MVPPLETGLPRTAERERAVGVKSLPGILICLELGHPEGWNVGLEGWGWGGRGLLQSTDGASCAENKTYSPQQVY